VFLLPVNRKQGRGVKKIEACKIINSLSREMVVSVYSFRKKEGDSGKENNVNLINYNSPSSVINYICKTLLKTLHVSSAFLIEFYKYDLSHWTESYN
jgi:hypothetical protein